jgi:hypothetical protein
MRVLSSLVLLVLWAMTDLAAGQVTIEPREDRYIVKIDGELFTQYIFKGYDKPILYPLIGPHGIPMTRNWPMAEAAPGEAKDHPHHKSLWFAHGDVNGIDFWAEGEGKGTVARGNYHFITSGGESDRASVRTVYEWRASDGRPICMEDRVVVFHHDKRLDFQVRLYVPKKFGDVTFGDTKEGTMAIRTRPELEIRNGATAVNSEGVTGREIWGKRAKWVDYSGVVDGRTVGVAIFDHPANPRHPTWWHARDYGLIAANPFGLHDFEKGQPRGAGDLKIPAGASITFRYRFVFHEGDAQAAGIAKMYEEYAESGTTGPGDEGTRTDGSSASPRP